MMKDLMGQIAQPLEQIVQPLVSADREVHPIYIEGHAGSSLALALAPLGQQIPLVCVMDDADEAGYLYSDLEQILGSEGVMMFPSGYRRAIKYGHQDEASILMRTMTLSRLTTARAEGKQTPIILTYPEAIAEGVAEPRLAYQEHLTVSVGQLIAPKDLMSQLYDWGYERVDYVYEPGQYAQRGSILDVFSYANERPYRIDYWDNDIDSIRTFEVESQLSVEQLPEACLVPNLGIQSGAGASLLELLPLGALLLSSDEHFLMDRLSYIWEDEPRINDGEGFDSLGELRQRLIPPERQQVAYAQLRHGYYRKAPKGKYSACTLGATPQPLYGKDYDALVRAIAQWQQEGYQIYLSAGERAQYQRILEIIQERQSDLLPPEHLPQTLHEGFVIPELKLVLLTEHQIFGRYHKYNLRSDKMHSGKMTLSLKDLTTFHPGDLVVHAEHGIGRFGGLISMDLGGRSQECVKIEYNKGDTIYVNLHSLHKLSHYRARDAAESVALSTLGTGAWQRLKEKTKKQVKDIARDLIKLYADRKASQGFAFSPDTYLQHELEASFDYIDTPDQEQATRAIKQDMERPYPMDRLLCGDVGFGKTEVAIRAAFKAAADGKQVALLVPTTVLAYQHYRTFSQRLEGFPVRVEYISRAKSPAELKAILADLKEGKIDIIIGTHRLTSKDVVFKDLGLLIIDEEQKFGVATKEKLRRLQVHVDTLTMSATPIPRTLQFSLMGARDLSNLHTPPANRVPVETILTRFSAEGIAEAINFELSRNGQVYVVHNRIQNIEEVAAVIRREVPDARLAIGHGQMPPSELEQILIDFGHHDYDVLVATTIIENGIDVPNANTIIIHDAHRYGLSELHQLRGRVGRSNRKAFCYLLTPPIATLSEESRRRVRAIEQFSDLGSGIRLALQDLDIRGAGNALGAEQSGFIADMGYETYQKVFTEAVRELKVTEFADLYEEGSPSAGKAARFVVETVVESDLELALPEAYVPSDAERIILYRELDELETDEALQAYRHRLIDRFGTPPPEVEDLIQVPRLRRIGQSLGFEKISLRSGLMSLFLPTGKEHPYFQSDTFGAVLSYVAKHSHSCEFRERNGRHIIRIKDVTSLGSALEHLTAMLALEGNHPDQAAALP